ncbi:hypothetical protein CGRA01v4_04460 [Colletotrichum graminicola]|nr:hypothetical protein CGRA01v4_04460 [Colletotrichum graminicola]
MNGAMQAHSPVAASCRQCDAQHLGVHELASEDKLGQPSGRPNPHFLCSSSLSRRPILAFSLVYSYTKVCNMEQAIYFIRQPADLVGTPLPPCRDLQPARWGRFVCGGCQCIVSNTHVNPMMMPWALATVALIFPSPTDRSTARHKRPAGPSLGDLVARSGAAA